MIHMIDAFDRERFRLRTHFNLRHNSVHSETWEKAIAEAVNGTWIKGSAYLADVIDRENRVCISVKSRKVDPHIGPRIVGRDFFDDPDFFHHGGGAFSEGDLDNLHTVSGRCSIPGLDENRSSADIIGTVALTRYYDFERKSLVKFGCDSTLDVVIVHGQSRDRTKYLLRVMFFDHTLNSVVAWQDNMHGSRSKYAGYRSMIIGYDQQGPHIGRVSNLGRAQTCMLRFYRKSQALAVIDTTIPMPKQELFDFEAESLLLK